MTTKSKGYTVDQVIEVIEMLSHSQGFYGRLLKDINYMKENAPDKFEEFTWLIELKEFQTPIDVVMFFEG